MVSFLTCLTFLTCSRFLMCLACLAYQTCPTCCNVLRALHVFIILFTLHENTLNFQLTSFKREQKWRSSLSWTPYCISLLLVKFRCIYVHCTIIHLFFYLKYIYWNRYGIIKYWNRYCIVKYVMQNLSVFIRHPLSGKILPGKKKSPQEKSPGKLPSGKLLREKMSPSKLFY